LSARKRADNNKMMPPVRKADGGFGTPARAVSAGGQNKKKNAALCLPALHRNNLIYSFLSSARKAGGGTTRTGILNARPRFARAGKQEGKSRPLFARPP